MPLEMVISLKNKLLGTAASCQFVSTVLKLQRLYSKSPFLQVSARLKIRGKTGILTDTKKRKEARADLSVNLERELNPPQREAVQYLKGPLLILAGAGSGKTRVLTYRIAHMLEEGVPPWSILALTFTNKAAGEMRQRVNQMVGDAASQIWVSTFHSTCARILRRYADLLGYERNFAIYDNDDQLTLMKEVFQRLDIDNQDIKERSVLHFISSSKDKMITPEMSFMENQNDYRGKKIATCYGEYQKLLRANNAMDFDDLICNTILLLRREESVRYSYQQRFRYIMVDEYQDTNLAQFQLLQLLTPTVNEEGKVEYNLCVVGDDDQSIYRFRGADIENILSFENVYPDCKVIKLEENYRSTQTILDAANGLISKNKMRKEKRLWTGNGMGAPLHYTRYETEYEEADKIVREIVRLVREQGASYRDLAILYRTNAQSRVFEEKLNQFGIPYQIVGGHSFYERKEIKDLLAYLQVIDNSMDDLAVRRILNVPRRGIGNTSVERISAYAAEHGIHFYDALMDAPSIPGINRAVLQIGEFVKLIEELRGELQDPNYNLSALLKEVIDKTGYVRELQKENTVEAKSRMENIDELYNIIAEYTEMKLGADEEPTLAGLLERVKISGVLDTAEAGEKEVTDPDDLVLLMTLHSAKGLEFPVVFLCGMEENVFPSYQAVVSDQPSDMEEERRLCYVGITRAKQQLFLSSANSRMMRGNHITNLPSRFLYEIPRHLFQKGSRPARVHHEEEMVIEGHIDQGIFAGNPFIRKGFGSSLTAAGDSYIKKGVRMTAAGDPNIKKGVRMTAAENPYFKKGFGGNTATAKPVPRENVTYKAGDCVRHEKFGDGVVVEVTPRGTDFDVTVDFDGVGRRRVRASVAKMEVVVNVRCAKL